jgi:galactose mutarotase-like enzyme
MPRPTPLVPGLALLIASALGASQPRLGAQSSPPSPPRLQTRWAALVDRDQPLPEYPRPQMVRPAWQSLNGRWEYAVRDKDAPPPATFDGPIVVPFAIESSLSGVSRAVSDTERLWYRRTFRVPTRGAGDRLLLHFGAVDWDATVFVNGTKMGAHRGGFDPFSLDITDALRPDADQELVVSVWDPTDRGDQPRGKQVLAPRGIWYTAVTGIWQSVWLEPVPAAHITGLHVTPDLDAGTVAVRVRPSDAARTTTARVSILDGQKTIAEADGPVDKYIVVRVPDVRPWSPTDPFLYGLRVALGSGDTVESYVGMRKIAVARDASGHLRLFLNGAPLFQYGLLDQGWWPDGLYTAPTDDALRFDVEQTKALGFNVARKHVKVEPERWYYHCDRLGLLVWQDMPSASNETPEGRQQFERELRAMVDARRNHPSIVMWVPFNEGWGQHATERYAGWLRGYDQSRLVNHASGWTDRGVGDVNDVHAYPGPALPVRDGQRARVLGEFGGLGLPVPGHLWIEQQHWGYRAYTGRDDLAAAYRASSGQVRQLVAHGLAAAIYTQTTDVETEVNGVMTYDRAEVKLPADAAALHASVVACGASAGSCAGGSSTGNSPMPQPTPTVTRAPFGRLPGGETIDAFTLSSGRGMELRVITYGGIITSWKVPDRDGRADDVVLGHDTLEPYLAKDTAYFGALVGRYANRIANARFTLDGHTYVLAANNGPHHLHGGVRGFDRAVWHAEPFERPGEVGVVLTHTSPDGDEGYPGTLAVTVTYTVTTRNELRVDYDASTDKATPVNLSQHTYFNLAGDGTRDVLGHEVTINADRFTPVDAGLIPTGDLAKVEGTPFDFRKPTAIGARIDADDEQVRRGRGYDHNFVLSATPGALVHAARVHEPTTGRVLDVFTDQPGIQFYSGNFLDGSLVGKAGRAYGRRFGFCLETQHFPDSPNQPAFPSTILQPGGRFRSTTIFAFSATE